MSNLNIFVALKIFSSTSRRTNKCAIRIDYSTSLISSECRPQCYVKNGDLKKKENEDILESFIKTNNFDIRALIILLCKCLVYVKKSLLKYILTSLVVRRDI